MSDPYFEKQQQQEREDYLDYLRQLVENDDLKGPEAGITKLVIDKGEEELSPKQAYVFKTKVTDRFPQPRCEQCGELIPWAEAYEHVHSPGRCASCEHSRNRFMAER